jgi:putative hemolysin
VRDPGYAPPPARFCAITGGKYTVTGNSNRPDETGTCALASGAECDAKAYYDGRCGS